MAFVTPKTWQTVSADTMTGTQLNQDLRDNVLYLYARKVSPASICNGRLTLTSGTPVTTSDVTAATSVYFTPYRGYSLGLYASSEWVEYTFSEITISLASKTANLPYDVFIYPSGGSATAELVAWTNTTTRATALATQNGVLVKTGSTDRRYVGTVCITGTTGQCEDSVLNRFVYNHYHRVRRALLVQETTNTWNYTTATWRSLNNSTTNRVSLIQGWAEEPIQLTAIAAATNTNAASFGVAIGEDSTSTPVSTAVGVGLAQSAAYGAGGTSIHVIAQLDKVPVVGVHYYQILEASQAAGTTSWYGDNGATVPAPQTGMSGYIIG